MKKTLLILIPVMILAGCAGHRKSVPSGNAEPKMLGVPESQVEQYIVDLLGSLERCPLEEGVFQIENLFDRIVAEHRRDTSRFEYLKLTELVSKYLYDPNSPIRDEDLYLPFVRRMAACEFTSEDMKPAYEYEASVCALNPRESIATDFVFRTAAGRNIRLHDIKAEYTVLFFSNPGCHACAEIVDILRSDELVSFKIADGSIAVVNVYIDEELDEWRKHLGDYPKEWYSGYDPHYAIRSDQLYNVRAIPSVYLLDADKTVILKDADVNRMMERLYELNTR